MSDPLVPAELLDFVVAYFQPRRVVLFGSIARGEATCVEQLAAALRNVASPV